MTAHDDIHRDSAEIYLMSPAMGGEEKAREVVAARTLARVTRDAEGAGDDGGEIRRLTDSDTGQYRVATETSCYHFDLDARTIMRLPGKGDGPDPEVPGMLGIAKLRRDGESVPLLEIELIATGERGLFFVDVRGDGIKTIRMTSLVRRIERVVF